MHINNTQEHKLKTLFWINFDAALRSVYSIVLLQYLEVSMIHRLQILNEDLDLNYSSELKVLSIKHNLSPILQTIKGSFFNARHIWWRYPLCGSDQWIIYFFRIIVTLLIHLYLSTWSRQVLAFLDVFTHQILNINFSQPQSNVKCVWIWTVPSIVLDPHWALIQSFAKLLILDPQHLTMNNEMAKTGRKKKALKWSSVFRARYELASIQAETGAMTQCKVYKCAKSRQLSLISSKLSTQFSTCTHIIVI